MAKITLIGIETAITKVGFTSFKKNKSTIMAKTAPNIILFITPSIIR